MERIVIEVDEKLAKAWQQASDYQRKSVGNKVNLAIAKEMLSKEYDEYVDFLNETREEMKDKGLTQETLNEILNNG